MNTVEMMMSVKIRPMIFSDLETVAAIEKSIYPFPWSIGNFKTSLSNGYCCQVCILSTRLAGYLVLMMSVDDAHLLTIGVAKTNQRQGVGAYLLSHALKSSKKFGAKKLFLEVRPTNEKALRLYRHFGFKQIGVRKNYYPAKEGREDALVFMRELDEVLA